MDARTGAASAILRRVAVALKTYTLYPPPSPVTDRAVGECLESLHAFIAAHGPFAVRVSRRALHLDETAFKDATSAGLAFQLYARKVLGVTVLPGVTAQELATFLAIVHEDRAKLEASGGISNALRGAGVQAIRVMEIVLAVGAPGQDESWGALWDLMADGHELVEEHTRFVVGVLRSGPAAIGGLFDQLRTMVGTVAPEHNLDVNRALCEVARNLDRVIAAQPAQERQRLYSHLAAAILLLDEPVRVPLQRALTASAPSDEMARAILQHVSEQRLVRIVPQSSLEARAEPSSDLDAPDPEMQILQAQHARGRPRPAAPVPPMTDDPSLDDVRLQAQHMDEASVTREVVGTLADLFRNQADEAEIGRTLRALEEHLPPLAAAGDYDRLQDVFRSLADGARRTPVHERALARLIEGLARTRLLNALVETLWTGRGTPVEEPVRQCLALMGSRIVAPLMMLLAEESRPGTRRMLCDLVATVARDRLDDIAMFAGDGRWYLARNVAYILGRLGDPRGIAHIAPLIAHRDPRVRSEAVAALASIGGPDSDELLVGLLDHVDGRMRLKAVLSMTDSAVRRGVPKMVRLLERFDPLQITFPLKQEIIAAFARARATEAVPALLRFSRRRLVLTRRHRTLCRLAKEAVATIQAANRAPDRAPHIPGVEAPAT
jgi:hypothetical protein